MVYRTILVHVDLSRHAPARYRMAAAIAAAHGAHLLGVAMTGISRAVFPKGFDAPPGSLSASHFAPLVEQARRALDEYRSAMRDTAANYDTRLVHDMADDGLARMARFADLVVASQDDPDEALTDGALDLPEYLILNSSRPVLVVPRTDPAPDPAPSVLLAWDGSKEAAFATSAALPLLRHARAVTVARLCGDGEAERDYTREQEELCAYLRRHGVEAKFLTLPLGQDSGADLLALARSRGCGLLVMGCYGHTRWRELCLGGASRTVLADATIPVLLAH
ncbi:universal stress protein [Massilia brevitalea]|uniref:universal stress protein n=1 Tax=Massilia brevitalea TaxID=442526 RepID=UPI0027385A62|nr:universal stress protein [Massilia brevitalea]